jgi:hypothetical protein
MDARGEANVWLGPTLYTLTLKTSLGATIFSDSDQGQDSAATTVYTPAGTGAVDTTVQAGLRAVCIFPENKGAAGDGATNDTAAIQLALTDAAALGVPMVFMGKTYRSGPFTVPSNSVIYLHPLTNIKAISGLVDGQRLVNITSVSNVTIHGNNGKCQMLKADYTSGEQRHGVFITSSNTVSIYDLNSVDTGGDGFYVGAVFGTGVSSKNINLYNCNADNNRRQGMSITSAVDMWVWGGKYSNTIGTAPAAGIDVEPDNGETIQNVNLINVKTSGNSGSGIIVVPKGVGSTSGNYFSLNIVGHESNNDALAGGSTADASLRFDNGAVPSNQINGRITVTNCKSYRSNAAGISIGYNSWSLSPELIIDGVKITDPGTTATASTGAACGVNMSTTFSTTAIDNIKLRNVYCEDLRGTKKMYAPFYISGATFTVTNSELINCDGQGYLLADGPFVFIGIVNGFVVKSLAPRTISFAGATNVDRYPGFTLAQSVSAVFTLPLASTRLGVEYEFYNSAGTTYQIAPNAVDIIDQVGLVVGEQLVLRSTGTIIRVKAIAANRWAVTNLFGVFAPQGFNDPKRVVYQTAAPTTRTWAINDRVINSTPTVGQPKSWVCTVAGTPGTWVSEGNL